MSENTAKWEYCVVTGIKAGIGVSTSYPYLVHFTGKDDPKQYGFTKTHLEKAPGYLDESDRMACTIAQLGEDGWEMVGIAPIGDGYHLLYFKRPKR